MRIVQNLAENCKGKTLDLPEIEVRYEGEGRAFAPFFKPLSESDEFGNEHAIAKGRSRNFEAL